ncbi:MAG TPA: family 16 glycoside hydrolase [Verrucomicrobiae bacterium]|nr:family 16 glycoside hydrolase [Verrucomicrobiae bacterium]
MKPLSFLMMTASALWLSTIASPGQVTSTIDHNESQDATASFKFKRVPAPSSKDIGSKAAITIVDGERDENGGEIGKLNDGKLPTEEDQPAENFFFNAGGQGGRVEFDLGEAVEVRQVNSYSWHPGTRGPQVYSLYASDGKADGFNAKPKRGTDPEQCGWKLVAKVDSRPKSGEGGGQYGVSVSDPSGPLGQYRYLLFDMVPTEEADTFGNTFYSEIDVVGPDSSGASGSQVAEASKETGKTAEGADEITIDTTAAPDLKEWAHNRLMPVVLEWYPKLVQALPSEGFEAPTRVSITFRESMRAPAATGGSRVSCNAQWFRKNLEGEAKGAVIHELVHVVQQYGRARRENPDAPRPPGWLVEGIPDYMRWFIYEPQSHGADITWMKTRRNLSLSYKASYRISANFLNWVTEKYDKQIVQQLNTALRTGKYNQELWNAQTGHSVEDLGAEWKKDVQAQLGAVQQASADPPSDINTLTDAEKAADWQLLFNGHDFTGWHNFKHEGVRPGWTVEDGALVCADPHNAGDIVTTGQFDWFELQLDYNISEAGNSGIMYHVTDQGNAIWATGPEFQLEDNVKAADPVRCGWLYALYQPPDDPNTGKPLDATKPVGQWNHVRLLVTPQKCEHDINGVKYFDYVLGSEDFNQRVAKSKFASMPHFAKSTTGYIGLQGDHGRVSFRNIKIRTIQAQ